MGKDTAKKIKLNFIFGILGQIVTLVIGIVLPRLFITNFGSEVNGFINSLNQVFVYVALLEAGVGSASLQKLYAPVGRNDRTEINKILSATNYFYNRSGILYVALIVILAFVYPLLVDSTLDYWLMVSLVLLSGISGALPYFFQAKYKLLLQAEGKEYIISSLATVTNVLLFSSKLVLLLLGFNVIAVQSVYVVINLTLALVYLIYIKKHYSWIAFAPKPDLSLISQRNSVLLHQISTLIFNNTDILVLTFFCDLSTVSIYVLYKNFLSLIMNVLSTFISSFSFKLGQSFSDRERFLCLFDVFEILIVALTFALFTITYIFITPFMRLYTVGMDVNYIIPYFPMLMCIMEILNYSRMPSVNVISYAGHFKQTQWRSVAEAAINLISSLVLVNLIGINGVVIGTILALLYRTIDLIIYANRKVLDRSSLPTIRLMIINIIVSITTVLLFNMLSIRLDSYASVILTAGITCIIVLPTQLTISFLGNRSARKNAMNMFIHFFAKG